MLTRKNKRSSISSLILLPAIFLVVGVAFLTIGIGLRISDQNKRERCTAKTQAEVVDIVSSTDSDGTTYAPVFSYTVSGQEYVKQRNSYSNPCNYYKGQKVALYYNPNRPDEFYADGDNVYKILFYVFGGIGAVFTIVSIAIITTSVKAKKNTDSFAQSMLEDEAADTEYFDSSQQ